MFYWRIYLPQSLKAAQDQSYSTLGAVAREVSQRLKGYDLVLQTAEDDLNKKGNQKEKPESSFQGEPTRVKETTNGQGSPSPGAPTSKSTEASGSEQPTAEERDQATLAHLVDALGTAFSCMPTELDPNSASDETKKNGQGVPERNVGPKRAPTQVDRKDAIPPPLDLVLPRVRRSEHGGFDLIVEPPSSSCPSGRFYGQIAAEELIPWTLVESEFDGLLILSFEQQSSFSIGSLLGQDRRLAPLPLGIPVQFIRDEKPIGLTEALVGARADRESQPKGSWFSTGDDAQVQVEVGGARYRALFQPVTVPMGTVGSKDRRSIGLVLCALVREDTLSRRAVALPPRLQTETIGFFLLGVFALPFLKLRFIGVQERMKARDVWLLGGSILMGSAVMLLLVLHAAAIEQLETHFDQDLRNFAAGLKSRVELESKLATGTLLDNALPLLAEAEAKAGKTQIGSILLKKEFDYPLFDTLFVADPNGMQVFKWQPRILPTPLVTTKTYDYFKRALALPPRTSKDEIPDPAFGTLVASTTGLELGVFALPAKSFDKASDQGIVGIATTFFALDSVPVPKPFEFVLINEADGKVQFAVAPEAFRDDLFLQSIARSESLARVILGDDPEGVTQAYYRGKDIRLNSREIPQLRARLVAFYPRETIESLASEMVSTTAFAMLIAAGLILLAIRIPNFFRGDDAIDWAWPSPRFAQHYLVGAAATFVLSVGVLIASALLGGVGRFWLMLCGPALLIMLFCVAVSPPRLEPESQSSPGLRYPWPFVALGMLAVIGAIAVPTGVLFDESFALVLAAQHESSHLVLDAERSSRAREPSLIATDRPELPDCEKKPTDPACSLDRRALLIRTGSRGDWEKRRRELQLQGPGPGEELNGPWDLPPMLATFAVATTQLQQHHRTTLLKGLRTAEEGGLRRVQPADPNDASQPLGSFSWLEMSRWYWLCLVLAVCTLGLLVWSIARYVLGLDLDGDGVLPSASHLEFHSEQRLLLLRPPAESLPNGGFARIDLRDPDLDPATLERRLVGRESLVLSVETRLDDAEWRRALLSAAENENAVPLFLVSEIDPLHYLTQRLCEEEESTPSKIESREKEVARWANAMQRFKKIRYPVPQQLPEDDARFKNLKLAQKLWDECRWSSALLGIMDGLLQRSDLNQHTWSELVSFVGDAAEPHYRSLWSLCSREEKLVMIQLSEEGLVNPKSVEIVRRLARRRLVRIDPRYRVMNESFSAFVRSAEPRSHVAEWEKTASGEGWARIGTPLYALGAMAFAVLLFAEQDSSKELATFATATTAAVTTLRTVVAAIRGSKPGSEAG
ncbi:MAG TPA: hypothetical protein VMR50_10475 [Myxococcota bacterium]|nr:hypothetical protein [Myxococcota bacterium]